MKQKMIVTINKRKKKLKKSKNAHKIKIRKFPIIIIQQRLNN